MLSYCMKYDEFWHLQWFGALGQCIRWTVIRPKLKYQSQVSVIYCVWMSDNYKFWTFDNNSKHWLTHIRFEV